MRKVTIHNIHDFFKGNFDYYKNKVIPVPDHIKEQLAYRLSKCGDCMTKGGCQGGNPPCGCPVLKKHFLVKSCDPNKFPDLMGEDEWNEFKKTIDAKEL